MGISGTVRFRVTAAQDPAGPQSVEGLDDSIESTSSDPQRSRILNNLRTCKGPVGAVVVRSPAIRSGKVLSTLMFSTGARLNTLDEFYRA